MTKAEWKWFGYAGHLVVSHWCRFHLCTQTGKYLVSTVGAYWPERNVREIRAGSEDPRWLRENKAAKGNRFDALYMARFGYEEIGLGRRYETMVFRAGSPCDRKDCLCGMPETDGCELDFAGYYTAGDATKGHMTLCEKWSKKK